MNRRTSRNHKCRHGKHSRRRSRNRGIRLKSILVLSVLFTTLSVFKTGISANSDNPIVIHEPTIDELNSGDYDYYVPMAEEEEDVTVDWKTEIDNGSEVIITEDGSTLTKMDLPDEYYVDIDYSTFQPYMDVDTITNTAAPAYQICHSYDTYSDDYGLMRKPVEYGFTVNGQDDIIVALGNFYKPKGTVGQRFLVVTTTGSYTVIVGDEKDDAHTDQYRMFSYHGDGYAGLIEFIVETNYLSPDATRTGSIKNCGFYPTEGDIEALYQIT